MQAATSEITGQMKSNTSEYNSWHDMIRRCYNRTRHNYSYYGGRGIKVCDRWLDSFDNFLKDMGEKPAKNYSLDRIDNDGNYTPENCRWSTMSEQRLNTRPYSISGHKGVYWNKYAQSWQVQIRRNNKTRHYGYFKNMADAIKRYESAVENAI